MNHRSSRDQDSVYGVPTGMPVWLKIGLIFIGIFFGLSTCSALAVRGTRRYLSDAKTSEAKNTLRAISTGIVACMTGDGPPAQPNQLVGEATSLNGLPPSAPAVPSTVPRGTKYVSRASEWSAPAFRCAKFSLGMPQYFQYEWEQVSPTIGVIHARGDLDGDGRVEANLSQEIRCTGSRTRTAGPLVVK